MTSFIRFSVFAIVLGAFQFPGSPVQAQSLNWEGLSSPYNGDVAFLSHDSHGRLFASTTRGISRSVDDAKSWLRLPQPPINALHTTTTEMIVAINFDLQENVYVTYDKGAVFHSSDHGDSWDSIPQLPTSIGLYSVERRGVQSTEYVTVKRHDENGNWLPAISDSTLFGSSTWNFETSFQTDGAHSALLGTNVNGVFLTQDDGKTWKHIHPGIECAVAFDGPDVFYCTSGGTIYRSVDHGVNWDSSGIVVGQRRVYDMLVGTGHTVYAACQYPGGIYASRDSGKNWEPYLQTEYPAFTLSVNNSGTMLATAGRAFNGGEGVDYLGVFRSENGTNWNLANAGLSCKGIQSLMTSSKGKVRCNLATSTSLIDTSATSNSKSIVFNGRYPAKYTGRDSWDVSLGGSIIFVQNDVATISDILHRPDLDQSDYWYALGYRSTTVMPNGDFLSLSRDQTRLLIERYDFPSNSWVVLSNLTFLGTHDIVSDNEGRLFVTANAKVFVSTDEGVTWDSSKSPSLFFNGAISVGWNNELYARVYPQEVNAGFFRSLDHGQTWLRMNAPFVPSWSYDDLGMEIAQTPGGTLYIAGSRIVITNNSGRSGVPTYLYSSTDDGAHWSVVNTPGLDSNVTALTIDSLGYIYIGLSGAGLWRAKLPNVSAVHSEIASSFALHPNVPNPFSTTTNVSFEIPMAGLVSVTVYNSEGMIVRKLSQEFAEAGSHAIQIDASSLPSGVYFYEVGCAGRIARQKMVIIR